SSLGRVDRVAEDRLPWVASASARASRPAHPAAPPTPATPGGNEAPPQMSLFTARAVGNPEEEEAHASGPLEADPGAVRPVLWQVHNTYLFAETRGGLIIVDQHSAHERVLYEEIMSGYDSGERESQRLLFPL